MARDAHTYRAEKRNAARRNRRDTPRRTRGNVVDGTTNTLRWSTCITRMSVSDHVVVLFGMHPTRATSWS